MTLPVTLCAAAAAAVLNIWLMARIASLRGKLGILHGDGEHPPQQRRMRAQANFIESAPLVLILSGLIEASGKAYPWLPFVLALYLLGRVAHMFGMDRETSARPRTVGAIVTLLTLGGLSLTAVLIAAGAI